MRSPQSGGLIITVMVFILTLVDETRPVCLFVRVSSGPASFSDAEETLQFHFYAAIGLSVTPCFLDVARWRCAFLHIGRC